MPSTVELETVGLFSVADRNPRSVEADAAARMLPSSANRVLRRGDHLFRSGDQVQHVYRVVGGVLKSYLIHPGGDEQIIGFYLPGDLIGCDALIDDQAAFSVVALDTASVVPDSVGCANTEFEAPFNGILDRQVHACMRADILRLVRLLRMERSGPDARLARFLLDYAEAQASRGYDRCEFRLPMGRKDLSRYIGLAPETVSRIFSRLRDQGILRVENNHICILDHAGLVAVVEGSP